MITKGDANSASDGLSVTKDNLFAKYLFHVPYVGKFSNLVHTPVGIGVVILIALYLIIGEIRDGKKPDEETEKEK